MKHIAIVSAEGIGDALITSIAAHNLRQSGFKVTFFSPHLHNFGHWLEKGTYLPYGENWAEALAPFDAILLQHDNTPRARAIVDLRKRGQSLYIFYTNYRRSKHDPLLEGFDVAFDETKKTMVQNVQDGIQTLFQIPATKQCALYPPPSLSHRKHTQRILIHPTSTKEDKNWLKSRYLHLAEKLQEIGYDPLFILSPAERSQFPKDLAAPRFDTLADLADTIYESGGFIGNDSGPAHIASYLSIPLTVICQGKSMPFWAPGWHSPLIIRPPGWVPNIKGMRLKENKWKYFITTKRVLKSFLQTLKQNRKNLYYEREEESCHERPSPPHEEAKSESCSL